MKKLLFILAIILLVILGACAANIEIPEEPEEKYTAVDYSKFISGFVHPPENYFHGFANKTGKFETTKFYHPKTGEYQGEVKINTGFSFDGEIAFIGVWYDKPSVAAEGCEITAVITRVENRLDKLKVVVTCIAPEKEGSHQIVYYLYATGTGNLIRTAE